MPPLASNRAKRTTKGNAVCCESCKYGLGKEIYLIHQIRHQKIRDPIPFLLLSIYFLKINITEQAFRMQPYVLLQHADTTHVYANRHLCLQLPRHRTREVLARGGLLMHAAPWSKVLGAPRGDTQFICFVRSHQSTNKSSTSCHPGSRKRNATLKLYSSGNRNLILVYESCHLYRLLQHCTF